MNDWIKLNNDRGIGSRWPSSSWAIFKDVNGAESLSEKASTLTTDYIFYNDEIDVCKLSMYKEIDESHALVKEYRRNQENE